MKDIIVYGAGGHAKILIDIIENSELYRVVGVIGLDNEGTSELMGYRVFKGDSHLDSFFRKGVRNIGIGIGGFTNNTKRKEVYHLLKGKGFTFPNIIDPSATISRHCSMGEANVIFAGVIINTEVTIGNNVVIATGSSIDHEAVIMDNVLVSAGVTIGAGNVINDGALIALGAKVVSRVNIGSDVLVGAGSVVTKDIKEPGVYIGIPARRIK